MGGEGEFDLKKILGCKGGLTRGALPAGFYEILADSRQCNEQTQDFF